VSYLGRSDLGHVDPGESRYDALGTGASEGVAKAVLSKGLVRGKTDKFTLVTGQSGQATPGSLSSDGRTGTVVTMGRGPQSIGATALKEEVAAAVSPTLTALFDTAEAAPETKAERSTSDRRAEAKLRGYVGDACPECSNFTMVRNGTCLKCDTCGSTTGCS